MRFLPTFFKNRIEHRPDLHKIFSNTGWLFCDKILRMGINLLLGILLARYLGPEQFGLLSFTIAFVSLFSVIATFGLNEIVVRDLVNKPDETNILLGTAFVIQLIGGLLAFLLAVGAISVSRPGDELAIIMVAILGFALVFKFSDVVKYWFESCVASKYVVWVESSIFFILAIVKIGLIFFNASLITFVWAAFFEGLFISVGLLIMYVWRGRSIFAWRPLYSRAKTLITDSWPLILSGLAIMVYMRIDQIMLGQMLGDKAVGIYTVAVRVSEVWYFIPLVIVASVFPAIIKAKKKSSVLYYQRLQMLYDLMTLLALLVAIPMTFLSDWIISFLFGKSYVQAGSILAIHIWASIFVFLGVASGKWLVLEGLQKYVLYRTMLGALVNILLNLLLIPTYDIHGAAIATVISYFVSVFAVLFIKRTRNLGYMMLAAVVIPKATRRVLNV